jgi:hypothetical protein
MINLKRSFSGSLVGAGFGVFAVLAYVAEHEDKDPRYSGAWTVDLHPKVLAILFGEDEALIIDAIDALVRAGCLERLGPYMYLTHDVDSRPLAKKFGGS